ncbi:TPA: hypothetical protein ACGPAL_001287 [Streptococcus suis]
MQLSFLDWISLLANIVTILGISGFLTDYLNKKRQKEKEIQNEKQQAEVIFLQALKDASMKLDIYQLSRGKIYRSTDYLRELKSKLEEWLNNIELSADTSWKDDFIGVNMSGEEVQVEETPVYEEAEYLVDGIWMNRDQVDCFYKNFLGKSSKEQDDFLRKELMDNIGIQYLQIQEGEEWLSDEDLELFIDTILRQITENALNITPFLNEKIDQLLEIQHEIDELLLYKKLFFEKTLHYIKQLKNPFYYFQDGRPVDQYTFSTEEYSQRRLDIIQDILRILNSLENL